MESRDELAKRSIKELLERIFITPREKGKYDLFVKIESSMALLQLINVLDIILKSEETEPAVMFMPLLEFLDKRWSFIKKTDACYPHAPLLKANVACRQAATFASIYFFKHAFELLMPTVKWNDFFSKNGNTLQLHELILDDCDYPMHVLQTLFMDENQNDNTDNTLNQSIVFYKNVRGCLEELTSLELIRLTNHSDLVQTYYLKLNAREIDFTQNVNWKDKLKDAFCDTSYVVTSSYDKEGDRFLKAYIFSQINTPQELVDLMTTHIPSMKDWLEFLSRSPSEELCRILLNIKPCNLAEKSLLQIADVELNKVVQNLDLVYEEGWIRARIYSLLELYNRTRDNAPESKSHLGYYASFVLPSSITGFFSKTRKLSSSDVFGEFLLSGHPLDDLEGYLLSGGIRKEQGLHEAHWDPLTKNPYPSFYGVSTLVKLVQTTTEAGKKIKEKKSLKYGS